MVARAGALLTTLAFFAVLALVYTWPLVYDLDTAYVHLTPKPKPLAMADAHLVTWMVSWAAHALRTGPLHLFDANILYPLPDSLALSEHLIGGALLVLPLDVLHHDPVLNHNLLLLATFAIGGAGATALVRELGGSLPAALAAGALFAFGPHSFGSLGHVNYLSTHWMPWALVFLHRLLATGRVGAGFGFAACLALQALSSVYYAYFFAVAVTLFLALHALLRCPTAPRAYRRALLFAALAALVVLPTFLPYRAARERYALERAPEQTLFFSANGAHYLAPVIHPDGYLRGRYGEGPPPPVLVGLGALVLAIVGVARGAPPGRGGRRLTLCYLGLAVGLALLSCGPVMRMAPSFLAPGIRGPYGWLARVLPGFDALRTPIRAAPIAVLALAVLAGLGADALVARPRPAAVRIVGTLLLAAVVVADCWRPEVFALPVPWAGSVPEVHRWLAAQADDAPIVFLPPGTPEQDGARMVLSTYHWRRMMNGYSGFSLAGAYLRKVLRQFPDAASLRLLHGLGVRWVVVERTLLPAEQWAGCAMGDDRTHLALRWTDDRSCVVEILGAPPAPPPQDRPVGLEGAQVVTSSGDDAGAVVDGDLRTHWVQAVTPDRAGWLQVDLPAVHVLTRLVLQLGPHFGEYPRRYQVQVSPDGERWFIAADEPIAEAPLVDLLEHPDRLSLDIPLSALPARHVRLVRPAAERAGRWDDWDVWPNWRRWGVHEIALYEAVP